MTKENEKNKKEDNPLYNWLMTGLFGKTMRKMNKRRLKTGAKAQKEIKK